jgi:hypothetical protein
MRAIVKDGLKWCSVYDAARHIKKSPTYVRLLIAEGSLVSAQMEPGGPLLSQWQTIRGP